MNISFSPPDISESEIQEVVDTLRSGWITTGPRTKTLEKRLAEYIGVNSCVCLNSATASMEMTLRVLGIGQGDQVITTAYTYAATASVIHHVGAEIVLVDTEKNSFEMDYEQVEKAITPRTKAIIPVDIGGRLCNYKRLMQIAENNKDVFSATNDIQALYNRLILISDSAHGLGAQYDGKRSGNFADFTCFSFHAVKNFTTAEGGAVVWRDLTDLDNDKLYRAFMLFSLHGQSKDALAKTKPGSWEYDILFPAYKCNMTDIQAAIGLKQLDRYENLLKRRRTIIERYDVLSREIGAEYLHHVDEKSVSCGHLYMLRLPEMKEVARNQVIENMGKRGVSTNVHFKPLPMLTAFKNMGFHIEDFPSAYAQYENEISLPLHTGLTDDEVEYVCSSLKQSIEEARG